MPTGERPRRPPRGFTYLGVLFLVAFLAVGLAALGQQWTTVAQRERERELVYRGNAIGRAIQAYIDLTPAGAARWPRQLLDLAEDRRGPLVRHHLREVYVDPFTGKADWELVPSIQQPDGFQAVRSRSDHELMSVGAVGATRRARDLMFPLGPAGSASAPVPVASAVRP